MILNQISLANWMPFRGAHRVEVPSGVVSVVARYEGREGRSNMAGKTAFLESVAYALFGWYRTRSVDDVVTEGEGEAHVEVTLSDGTVVCRGRECGGQTVFSVAARAGVNVTGKDAEAAICNHLGVGEDEFLSTFWFRQGELTAFVDATPAKRAEVLSGWLKQDHWEDCEARARAELREVEDKARACFAAARKLETGFLHEDTRRALEHSVETIEKTLAAMPAQVERAEADEAAYVDRDRLLKARDRFEWLRGRVTELRRKLAVPSPYPRPAVDVAAVAIDLAGAKQELRLLEKNDSWG